MLTFSRKSQICSLPPAGICTNQVRPYMYGGSEANTNTPPPLKKNLQTNKNKIQNFLLI